MMSSINTNPTTRHLPARHNITKDFSGLSPRETEILNQIKTKVSATLGATVKMDEGVQSDCGQFTLAFVGAVGASACGTRSPVLVNRNMLAQMAESEEMFHHFMSVIEQNMQQTIETENWLRNNLRKAEQEDAQRREQQIRNSLMLRTDFWNVDRSEGQSQVQAAQRQAAQRQAAQAPEQVANRYEQMLATPE